MNAERTAAGTRAPQTYGEEIVAAVLSRPGTEAVSHRFGGIEFRLGRRQLGHIHGNEIADLPLRRSRRDELIAAGRAQAHRWRPGSGWVTIQLSSKEAVIAVIDELRSAYQRALAARAREVRVEPIGRAWAEALSEGDDVFSSRFGIPVEPDWAGFPEALPILLEAAKTAASSEWRPQLFFDHDGALVGNGGWKGPPQDGSVELGYAVAPSRQRRGIATAVVRELVERARRAGIRTVLAHTLAEENPSTKVLERCGFTRMQELIDPDEGAVWRWELPLG